MKSLFVSLLVSLPFITLAQNRKMYSKVSAGVFLPQKDQPAAFNPQFSFGPRIGNYIGAGINIGFYRVNGDKTPVIPVGLDLSFLDFNNDAVSLSATVGCGFPIYSSEESRQWSGGTFHSELKGAFQAKAGVGVAFPLENNKKLMIMGGYSPLFFKSKTTETRIWSNQTDTKITSSTPRTDLFFLAIEIIL